MEIIIGLAVLGLVVWYIYKKVIVSEGKIDSQDAVAVDMAVTAVGGMATGATIASATAVENKVEEVKAVEAKVETAVVEEAKESAAELVKEADKVIEEVAVVEEPVVAPAPAKPKRTRKKKAK